MYEPPPSTLRTPTQAGVRRRPAPPRCFGRDLDESDDDDDDDDEEPRLRLGHRQHRAASLHPHHTDQTQGTGCCRQLTRVAQGVGAVGLPLADSSYGGSRSSSSSRNTCCSSCGCCCCLLLLLLPSLPLLLLLVRCAYCCRCCYRLLSMLPLSPPQQQHNCSFSSWSRAISAAILFLCVFCSSSGGVYVYRRCSSATVQKQPECTEEGGWQMHMTKGRRTSSSCSSGSKGSNSSSCCRCWYSEFGKRFSGPTFFQTPR
eukprot:gene23872-biopygen16380